jgi:prepilin-type processing-associated H-X9-DG protein
LHPNGAQHAFVDGSVQFIKQSIEATAYDALVTRGGGESVTDY